MTRPSPKAPRSEALSVLQEVLAAIRRSGGDTVALTESDIVAAVRKLTGMGLYAEPTSAQAAAAVDAFVARGVIKPGGNHGGYPDGDRP
ncbi:hypothetical protein [Leminorella grimontii]|uniref:hypothetical protein n=1 Tax=Leminorella grimontii TaxID=82981 RepID=UPI001C3FDF8F|nr:hypothetical protein [Leminorella grimontii]